MIDYKETRDNLVTQLKNFVGEKAAIVGVSGGIDSAVILKLCRFALTNPQIVPVILPYGDQGTEDSIEMIESLNPRVVSYTVNIKPMVDAIVEGLPTFYNKEEVMRLVIGNIKARVRMTVLYGFAGMRDGLVIGTGNKTEIEIGYCTKYGDGGVDVEPIGDLYKHEVSILAKVIGVIDKIIYKAPSAELWDGQTDEEELGLTYSEIDYILMNYGQMTSFSLTDKMIEDLAKVKNLMAGSEHKRNTPPIFKVDR